MFFLKELTHRSVVVSIMIVGQGVATKQKPFVLYFCIYGVAITGFVGAIQTVDLAGAEGAIYPEGQMEYYLYLILLSLLYTPTRYTTTTASNNNH